MTTQVRKGQAPGHLERGEFAVRFRDSFVDPAFRAEDGAIARLEEIAWHAYSDGRKSPITRKAGPGYADPDYDLSVDWIETKERLDARPGGLGRSGRRRRVPWSSAARRATTAPARARSRRPFAWPAW